MRQEPSGDIWQPPPLEAYKLNFDATIFSDSGKSRYGAIIRNEKGEVMAAMTASGPKVRTSDEAELLACRRAIEFVVDARFSRMIIEGDNNNVIQAISSSVENTSLFGNVVDDNCHLMQGMQWLSVYSISRDGNQVAHALAQYARNTLDEDLYRMEDSPPLAMDALYHDLSFL
nr:uncharacterized protein LOC112030796 [Quercus suber]